MASQLFEINGMTLTLAEGTFHLQALAVDDDIWLQPGGDGQPLWQVQVVNAAGQQALLDGSHAGRAVVEQQGNTLLLTWSDVRDTKLGAGPFTINVHICAGPVPSSTAWSIEVENPTTDFTLWQVTFPNLPGFLPAGDGEDDRLFYPHGWGTQRCGWSAMEDLDRWYPKGWDFTMQFLGYTRGEKTFYLGVHDPQLMTKRFFFTKNPTSAVRQARFAVSTYPEGMTLPGNSFRQQYKTIVAVCAGDWYDAAQLYAGWSRRQSWVAPFAVEREIHAWQLLTVPAKPLAEWETLMETLAARVGVKLGIHFYQWHQIPFDMSYPDYFPAREGFAELVAQMRRVGYTCMPYINARLWDINANSWSDDGSLRAAAKNSSLRMNPRTLVPYYEEYGSGQKLAPMCPTTHFWQDTVLDLSKRIINELGCDGIYFDQIAAAESLLCFDPEHGHPLGGGAFWLQGYRQMLARVRAVLGPLPFLTTECNWEGCGADYDALLMWHSFGSGLIPLFPAIYAGRVRTFGCQFDATTMDEDGGREFATRMAMCLVWGAQLGWGDLTLLLAPERAALLDFFVTLARLRADHAVTFAEGRLLRNPDITTDVSINASLWQRPDGHATLFLVNPTREQIKLTARITAVECAHARILYAGADGLSVTVTLPPLGALAIAIEVANG